MPIFRKHHSLQYLWCKFLNKAWALTHSDAPWLPRQTIHFLDGWLKKDFRVLETGSGRSTLWLAKRVFKVVSIEHNREWYDTIASSSQFQNLANIELLFADTEPRGALFASDYVRLITSQPDFAYDLLIVDGVLRDEVALAGLSKVKPGGAILLDNAERYIPIRGKTPEKADNAPTSPLWIEFLEKLEGRPRNEFTDGVTASVVIML
jgi:SAM-dependent methyltransferase